MGKQTVNNIAVTVMVMIITMIIIIIMILLLAPSGLVCEIKSRRGSRLATHVRVQPELGMWTDSE